MRTLIKKYELKAHFDMVKACDKKTGNYLNDYYFLYPVFTLWVKGEKYKVEGGYYSSLSDLVKERIGEPYTLFLSHREGVEKVYYRNNNFSMVPAKEIGFENIVEVDIAMNIRFNVNKKEIDKALMYLFREILEKANYVNEFKMDDFLIVYGYDKNLNSVRKGERLYKSFKKINKKLGLSEDKIYDLLYNLAEKGIE